MKHLGALIAGMALLPLAFGLCGCVHPIHDSDVEAATLTRDGKLEVRVFQGG